MYKKIKILFLTLVTLLINMKPVSAGGLLQDPGALQRRVDPIKTKAGFLDATSGGSLENITETVISAFLGLLAVIFIILMLIAGYNWMTAAGDEEKVTKAKNTIRRAIIGLIILITAYSITYFVFSNLPAG